MSTLVVGASGMTGRLLVRQLLDRGEDVRAVVRSPDRLFKVASHAHLSIIPAAVLDLGDGELAQYVRECRAVASCLGHNLTLKGIYGSPRRLVVDATRRLCRAIWANQASEPTKFVLMNTAGNSNRNLPETVSMAESTLIKLLRLVLPPHVDNEQAADYLREHVDRTDSAIQWSVVRPDTLINEDTVSPYEIYPSPTRSALFNPGKTSRINTAHFMAELITDEGTWSKWRGQMPVIYNKGKLDRA